ncbi:flagellin [Clostridium cochlearium]|uniref:Flagellin n=1 Tax=Clostridium cochlearium TaxID=1494 RepID=A0A2X2WIF2_CLOCO|nr:flagellin [Clostridium cochlearium]SQB35725.1 flagellin/flagellar hook associated protein [Clostridium cochlearium]
MIYSTISHFTYNILKNNNIKNKSSVKKLSSGLRINNAADDAAGLAISEKMRAQIRGLNQASRNVQDFISMMQVVDGGLNDVTEAMQRMRELSITALNGTYTNEDREMIQNEYGNLKEYINNVSFFTEFNTINVYEEHRDTYEKFKGNKVLDDEVTVIKGVTDYLGVKVDGELKEIYLDSGIYTREAFVDMLDDKLWDVDRNLIPSLDKNNVLSLSAENCKKIDGLVGGALSFFYEYHISMGAGTVFGSSDLSGKLDIITGSNDKFTFTIEDKRYNVKFPPTPYPPYMGKGYTADEIVNIMQEQLDAQGADVKVYMNGNQIALDAGYRIIDGFAGNMIKIDGITSILYDNAKHGKIHKTKGYTTGRVSINSPIEIKKGENDTISFYLDDDNSSEKNIVLEGKTYNTIGEIVDEVNKKLEEQNIEAFAEASGTNLKISSKKLGYGSKIKLLDTANGYIPLFCEITEVSPTYNNGETIANPPPEGSTTPTYDYKSAYVMSSNFFNGITIDGSNDKLNFNVSGINANVNLTHGRFNSINEFKDSLQKSINNAGIENVQVKIYNSNKIVLETKEKGEKQYFSGLSGSGYKDIFVGENILKPYSNTGTTTYSYIQGRSSIGNNFEINSTNKNLSFDYIEDGKITNVSIELEEKTYATRGELINEINNKLGSIPITAKGYGSDAIELIVNNGGNNYKMENFSGGFYDNVFKSAVESVILPDEGDGYTNSYSEQQCYIVGRKDISNGVVINPGINDVLTFDLRDNGSIKKTISIKIPAEHHSPQNLINKINEELQKQGITNVKAEYGTVNTGTTADDSNKLVLRYINEEEGYYTIDGVRGNSAYSIFYNASGDPIPTYTVGIINLSQGVTIAAGENDTFTFDVDKKENTITLSEGEYTAETLLQEINNKLSEINSEVVASYYEGRLKLGYKGVGFHTIDNIRGNARDTLFMELKGRNEVIQNYVQAGANEKEGLVLEPFYMSSELLRINTTLIGSRKLSQKSLIRLDNALKSVLEKRGQAGAYQNRLESIYRNNENYAKNLQASESRITDLDMAKEVMEFVKTQILGQVSQAMLAQSNDQSQRLIQLFLDRK